MKFKVGDKVQAARDIGTEYPHDHPADIPPDFKKETTGVVTAVYTDVRKFPYDVQFRGSTRSDGFPVDEDEIEFQKSRFRNWLNRHFPKWLAEEKFGNQETVDAARIVLNDEGAVSVPVQEFYKTY